MRIKLFLLEDLVEREGRKIASKNRHLAKCMTNPVRGLKINSFFNGEFLNIKLLCASLEDEGGKRQLDSKVIGILLCLFVSYFRKIDLQSPSFNSFRIYLDIKEVDFGFLRKN